MKIKEAYFILPIFLFVFSISRTALRPLNLEKFDPVLKQFAISPNSYVFDRNYWFLDYDVKHIYDKRTETFKDTYKNFDILVFGPSERKDIIIHTIAWSAIVKDSFSKQVLSYYFCENGILSIPPAKLLTAEYIPSYQGKILQEGILNITCEKNK